MVLCTHHFYLVLQHSYPPKETPFLLKVTPHPLPSIPNTTNPVSLSVDWPVLDVSCQRNHTLCVLLCLASLTEHRVFEVHPRGSLCQSFTPFHGWVLFLAFI